MQARSVANQTTLNFQLLSQKQFKEKSPQFVDSITSRAPAIAHQVCLELGLAASSIDIEFLNDKNGSIFGGKFLITAYSDTGLSNSNDTKVSEAITKAIGLVDRDNIFNFESSYSVKFSDKELEHAAPTLTWKVEKIDYRHNVLNHLSHSKITLLDESEKKYVAKSHSKTTNFDRWGNVSGITYERRIAKAIASESHERLLTKAKNHVGEDQRKLHILAQIAEKKFDEAFTKSCFAGDSYLVNLFFEFDQDGELNIDINNLSLNGITPLDNAIASKNESIVELLKINGAKSRADLIYQLEDNDRKEGLMQKLEIDRINRLNQSRRGAPLSSFDHNPEEINGMSGIGSSSVSPLQSALSPSVIGHMLGSRIGENLIDMINEQNRRQREAMFMMTPPGQRAGSGFGPHTPGMTPPFASSHSSFFGGRGMGRGSSFGSGMPGYGSENSDFDPFSPGYNNSGFGPHRF